MSVLGNRLRKAREKKKLNQVEVFKKTKINNKTLSRYENGGSEPDLETLKILASLYEVSVDWLTGATDNPNIKKESIEEIERRLLEEFDKLSQEDKDYVIGLIRKIQKE